MKYDELCNSKKEMSQKHLFHKGAKKPFLIHFCNFVPTQFHEMVSNFGFFSNIDQNILWNRRSIIEQLRLHKFFDHNKYSIFNFGMWKYVKRSTDLCDWEHCP
jgi:hypothetical protein